MTFISRLITLPVIEAAIYKSLWSEFSEEFWRKRNMKSTIRIAWKKLQRGMWRQEWGIVVL